jgi:HEAT repeat protein
LAHFGDYCQALFWKLAVEAPRELSSLVRDASLPVHHLTYAAEALGSVDADLAVTPLLLLLSHPSSIVREGAIYGLGRHLAAPRVRETLLEIAQADPSAAVRTAATDALSDE